MRFLTAAVEAQLHREVYITLLNSLLKQPGRKQELAQQAGITPVYLSYILKLDRDLYRPSITRTPSPAVAERIAQVISAPPEIKESLLSHMLLASEKRSQAHDLARAEIEDHPLAEVVNELKQILNKATFAADPTVAKRQYQVARDTASTMLRQIPPEVNPLAFVELCSILHEVQCILNRPDDALWHAKQARLITESLDRAQYRQERERFDYLAIDALRAEAIAYYHLAHYREAINLCDKANITKAMKQQPNFWKPQVWYDKIKALSSLPRFPITEIENLADESKAACEQRVDEDAPLS